MLLSGTPFLGPFFTPGTPSLQLQIYFNYDDIWQIHLTRASFLCLIYDKMSKKQCNRKNFFGFMILG